MAKILLTVSIMERSQDGQDYIKNRHSFHMGLDKLNEGIGEEREEELHRALTYLLRELDRELKSGKGYKDTKAI
jgi:hypothetical protein